MWCIPPEQNGPFVCAMENVLEVYKRPYDPLHPMVCMDEASKQLVGEIQKPIPLSAGQPLRYDYEYHRNGVTNIFMLCEPLRGWRKVNITARKTRSDWAGQMKELVDLHYPHARRITVVMDNYPTHQASSLYEAFPPQEARRLLGKLELVYTPKHGSWLNMAEIELCALGRQCTEGRISDLPMLIKMVGIWERDRNNRSIQIDWQFSTEDARIKLRRLYPKIIE
jgi:DDE superfamily endonuclease